MSFSVQHLAKLNETKTLHEIEEIVREQEQLQMREKASQLFKKKVKQARIEVKKAKRRSKH
jgi:SpoVK/Ycf46/Vps4 family AAA+-type ATPase